MIWWPESVPTLKGATNSGGELTLRSVVPADSEDIFRAAQDPEVPRFTSLPAGYTIDNAISFTGKRLIERFQNRLEIAFRIESEELRAKTGNSFCGVISLHSLNIPNHKAEIGYWLAKEARGMGIGTAAAEMITDYGLMTLGFNRIEAKVNVQNEPSKYLLLKAGYIFEHVIPEPVFRKDGSRVDLALYSITK